MIRICHKLWLDGETDFDYSVVDGNEQWDDCKQKAQDSEDAWFDSEEQDCEMERESVYTGVQDF